MIMFFVYILQSIREPKELYISFTHNIQRRLKEHNQKLSFATKPYAPWKLIYPEGCLNQKDALHHEHYLKTNQGRRFIKRRLKEYFYHQRYT